jgi:metallopeptidase MepB
MRRPPQSPPSFSNITPATIRDEITAALKDSSDLRDRLTVTLTPSSATFANLVRPLLEDSVKARRRHVIPSHLMARVSSDPAIREAARDAFRLVASAEAANILRPDIARLVAAVFEREMDSTALDAEDKYVLAHLHDEFARSGAQLVDEIARERLAAIESEVSLLDAAAVASFSEKKAGWWFTRSELAGCPESWLATLENEDRNGKEYLHVMSGNGHPARVLGFARQGETRRRILIESAKQNFENVERLEKLVVLRDEAARLLGYQNHAFLRMETTMAKSIDNLMTNISGLHAKLRPPASAETDVLLALKREETQSAPDDPLEIYDWDVTYYSNIQSKQSFSVDHVKVSEYFEINHAVSEMLRIFEDIFGMEFERRSDISAWHHSVSAYAVWDAPGDGGSFLGYLYVDVFGRPGKFTGQYHSRIQPVRPQLDPSCILSICTCLRSCILMNM